MSTVLPEHKSHYAELVEQAIHQRNQRQQKSGLQKSAMEGLFESLPLLETVIAELHRVNEHIKVDDDLVADAAADYQDIGQQLIRKLGWQQDDISVVPQGSSSTKTLIRSPTAEKFDIDAVCKVVLNRSEVWDPIGFFNQFQPALEGWTATAKNRCWRIEELSHRYYIEFTPSVPLALIPANMLESVRYRRAARYGETALAVVDRFTESWKTSNPEGMTHWVNDQSKRQLVLVSILEKSATRAMDGIAPVPEQVVPLSDTLRVAIRLFKRHRDMMVSRGLLDGDAKPISIIIVTLLTQCYEGLADKGQYYQNPVELLRDLAELMPGMVEQRRGQWWIENPTVAEENFAERWSLDKGQRKAAFDNWCEQLEEDMRGILDASSDQVMRERIRAAFGTVSSSAPLPPSQGLATQVPTRPITAPAKGLA
ncbi:MAG: nucleotidyltransferase [Pseudomonadota bacterium]